MDDSSVKTSMNTLHRDVTSYVQDLEQKLTQLEQNVQKAEQGYTKSSSITNIQNQLQMVFDSATIWQSGELEKSADTIDQKINSFLQVSLPKTISPFNKQLDNWKVKFNASMTNTGKLFQNLNSKLKFDTKPLENCKKVFHNQKLQIAKLSRDVEAFDTDCQMMKSEFEELIDSQERELSISLSGLSQQLQIDLMRAKATSDLTLQMSLSNSETSSFNDFFTTLQSDVNAKCSLMEKNVKEVQNLLEASERTWDNDVATLKEEIRYEIEALHVQAGAEFTLQKRLNDAIIKAEEIEKRLLTL